MCLGVSWCVSVCVCWCVLVCLAVYWCPRARVHPRTNEQPHIGLHLSSFPCTPSHYVHFSVLAVFYELALSVGLRVRFWGETASWLCGGFAAGERRLRGEAGAPVRLLMCGVAASIKDGRASGGSARQGVAAEDAAQRLRRSMPLGGCLAGRLQCRAVRARPQMLMLTHIWHDAK